MGTIPPSFEVSQIPLEDFLICGIRIIELFSILTNAQSNQINTLTRNNQISLVPPNFELSSTALKDFPISGTRIIEMS
jgi:hypothetical protein